MNFARGVTGTILCGALGGGVPLGIALTTTVGGWLIVDTNQFDRQDDLRHLFEHWLAAVVTCSTLCACAGWATFAPAGVYRFARSLAIVFLESVSVWLIGSIVAPAPPRQHKGMERPGPQWSGILAPPVVVALILGAIRIRTAPLPEPQDMQTRERKEDPRMPDV